MGIYCIKIWIVGFFLENKAFLAIISLHSCMTTTGWRRSSSPLRCRVCSLVDHSLRRSLLPHTSSASLIYLPAPALPTSLAGEGRRGKPVSLCNVSPRKGTTRTLVVIHRIRMEINTWRLLDSQSKAGNSSYTQLNLHRPLPAMEEYLI